MNDEPLLRKRLLKWSLVLGIWTLFAVFDTSSSYLILRIAGKPTDWWRIFLIALAEWYTLAALAQPVFLLARRFPFEAQRWPWSLLVHLPVAVAFALLDALASQGIHRLLGDGLPRILDESAFPQEQQILFYAKFYGALFVYGVVLVASHAIAYYRKFRERELRASQLEAQLAQAQLQVLKMQLHPHFLFNTLNAIAALMHQDVELADRMIARLGELLRSTLENAGTQEVPLRQELEFIQPYLEIEQARLGARLSVRMDIDPEAMDARVPNLFLQPLVENAIRHGIAPRTEPGRIDIRAQRQNGTLTVQVCDDGPGLPKDMQAALGKGIGVANTRARLRRLYGANHSFDMANGAGRGLVVTITLPFCEAAEEPNGACTEGNGSHAHPDRR